MNSCFIIFLSCVTIFNCLKSICTFYYLRFFIYPFKVSSLLCTVEAVYDQGTLQYTVGLHIEDHMGIYVYNLMSGEVSLTLHTGLQHGYQKYDWRWKMNIPNGKNIKDIFRSCSSSESIHAQSSLTIFNPPPTPDNPYWVPHVCSYSWLSKYFLKYNSFSPNDILIYHISWRFEATHKSNIKLYYENWYTFR